MQSRGLTFKVLKINLSLIFASLDTQLDNALALEPTIIGQTANRASCLAGEKNRLTGQLITQYFCPLVFPGSFRDSIIEKTCQFFLHAHLKSYTCLPL